MMTKVLSFQKENNLAAVQVLTSNADTFNYVAGPFAIKENLVRIKEVNDSGAVNTLLVFNLSKHFVFFMDGDILTGAKQNRVLNTSVLLAPNSKMNLPVSCVEQGRWSYRSENFGFSDYISLTGLRAKKARTVKENLKKERGFSSDQGEVWENVSIYQTSYKIKSETSNLSDVFEKRRSSFDELLDKLRLNSEANGIALFANSKLLSIDIFNRKEIYADYFPRIIRGTAMEAFKLKETENEMSEAEGIFKTVNFLDQLENVPVDEHKGAGAGTERRFESNEFTGFELRYENHLIHLTALNLK